MLNAFHDVRFPLPLSLSAQGGPVRNTQVITLFNGMERRNTAQANSRRRYVVGAGIQTKADVDLLLNFFEARRGQLHSFRFRDPMDFKSCSSDAVPSAGNQIIGIGDGVTTEFQLIKTYADASGSWIRNITRPTEIVLVEVDGASTNFTSLSDGKIVFDTPPKADAEITAGFEFDVPVRFDTPELDIRLDHFSAAFAPSIPLIEVRDDG